MNIFYLNREHISIHDYSNLINTSLHINNHYYFLLQGKKIIIQYNPIEKIYKRIYVNHVYSALCYDETSKCFWAFDNNSHILYKLNYKFEEVQIIKPFNQKEKKIDIISLSYDVYTDCLIICSKHKIYVLEKIAFNCIYQSKYNHANVLNIAYINNFFILLVKNTEQQDLKFYDTSFKFITSIPIPSTINAQGFMINQHYSDTRSLIVSILNIRNKVTFFEHIILHNPIYCLRHSTDGNHQSHLDSCSVDCGNVCKVDGGLF